MKKAPTRLLGALALTFAVTATPAFADNPPAGHLKQHSATTETLNDPRIATLSQEDEELVLKITTDPRFGIPEYGAAMEADFPELKYEITSGSTSPAAQDRGVGVLAVGNRAYTTVTWKVLGVSYGSVTTEANFNNTGARVTKVNSCWHSSSNFLPGLRSFSGNSYHSLSSGILTCKTDWIAKFATRPDERITQGFRVTGNGTFLSEWP